MATKQELDMISSTGFDIDELIKNGINNELQLTEALEIDKQLRKLSASNPELKIKRSQIRDLIQRYESENWDLDSVISNKRINESEQAELVVQSKAEFIKRRKELVKAKLKRLNLNQQEFGRILGHNSKSYVSELMNGVSPFALRDLVVIGKLLRIDLDKLVFNQIPLDERKKIELSIRELNKPELTLDKDDFALA